MIQYSRKRKKEVPGADQHARNAPDWEVPKFDETIYVAALEASPCGKAC